MIQLIYFFMIIWGTGILNNFPHLPDTIPYGFLPLSFLVASSISLQHFCNTSCFASFSLSTLVGVLCIVFAIYLKLKKIWWRKENFIFFLIFDFSLAALHPPFLMYCSNGVLQGSELRKFWARARTKNRQTLTTSIVHISHHIELHSFLDTRA